MSGAVRATRLTVFTTETALAPDGRPLHLALVERARRLVLRRPLSIDAG